MKELADFASGIFRREWRVVAVVAALAIVFSSIAPAFGLWRAAKLGTQFTGVQALSPGDLSVYLSSIDQVKRGAFFIDDVFTVEPIAPAFNALWFAVGMLAKTLHISSFAAFHLSRILLLPGLVVTSYFLITRFFSHARDRLMALVLFVFGSGCGAILQGLFRTTTSTAGGIAKPIDVWVGESNAFLTASYSPHFVASFTLIFWCVLLFLFALETRRQVYAIVCGVSAALLFQFHPFHAPTLFAIFGAFLVWLAYKKTLHIDHVISFVIFAGCSLPWVAYHYFLAHDSAASIEILRANLTLTPSIWHVAIGFGAVFVLAPIGYFLAPKYALRIRDRDMLAVWAVTQFMMVYAPLAFQRRLLEGLEFPLVLLAVPAIVSLMTRLRRAGPIAQSSAAIVGSFIFFFSSFFSVARNVTLYRSNEPPIFFFDQDKAEMLRWVRTELPQSAVLFGAFGTGNAIGGWADRRVYAGHWANTVAVRGKMENIARFFGSWDDAQRAQFARANGITDIVVGPEERAFGGFVAASSFAPEFSNKKYAIYRVRKPQK